MVRKWERFAIAARTLETKSNPRDPDVSRRLSGVRMTANEKGSAALVTQSGDGIGMERQNHLADSVPH
jgi:hypothetical protein